jgi:hypothetical protein
VNIFDFRDKTDANGTTTTIIVPDANLYDVNDVIEYDNDGVVRTVTDVNTTAKTITFDNALDANSVKDIYIHNWGGGANNLVEDYHITSDSLCINAGDPNGDYDGEKDIDGEERVSCDIVDIGADEADCCQNWVLPTGCNDPESCWNFDPNAYDGNFTTYAYVGWFGYELGAESGPLELTHDGLNCNRIRYKAGTCNAYIQIWVYYNDDWHIVHDGYVPEPPSATHYIELGGTYWVTGIKFVVVCDTDEGSYGEVSEAQFCEKTQN